MPRAYNRYSFYGIVLCQGHWYFKTYREDPLDLKLTVSGAFYAPDGTSSSGKFHRQVAGILCEDLQSEFPCSHEHICRFANGISMGLIAHTWFVSVQFC